MRSLLVPMSLVAAAGAACAVPSGSVPAGAVATPVAATALASPSAPEPGDQTMIRCESDQQAIIDRSNVGGRPAMTVSCVSVESRAAVRVEPNVDVAPASTSSGFAPSTPPVSAPAVVERPTRRPVARRASYEPEPRPVVRRAAYEPDTTERVVYERRPARSWQRRALVIGGSTGVGAGVGALIGGRKGALIGAAIGGGGATLYETRKKD
ncbi:MAG: hypothetical protein U0Q12_22485 [Vicinamibacterales bacterium]